MNDLRKIYRERYGSGPVVEAQAPGRLEVIGNHTDYNLGTVLSVAVDRTLKVVLGVEHSNICHIWDDGLQEERCFDISSIGPAEKGDWSNYIKGMVIELKARGLNVHAFNAVIDGDVPLSAGMSSSAAFEMAIGTALCKFACTRMDWKELAKAGQACENNYIGANTGLMDQFSSLKGQKDCLVYSDFRTLEARPIAMPQGLTFVVVNCMVKHVLTTEYNDRRRSCETAVAAIAKDHPQVKSLRDVDLALLEQYKGKIDGVSYNCAEHVVREIGRVEDGVKALAKGDVKEFGRLMFQSHDSSRRLFLNSCEELDTIIDLAAEMPECLGARLSGGGFGGITVHLVPTEDAEAYAAKIAAAYEAKTGKKPQVLLCVPSQGAK